MYLTDIASGTLSSPCACDRLRLTYDTCRTDAGSYQARKQYGSLQRGTRRPPAPPTSIPLDDSFDAVTTEVPTEWRAGEIVHRDYEESISGYRNYVAEMERKLSGEYDDTGAVRRYNLNPGAPGRERTESASGRGSRGAGRKSVGDVPIVENARQVSGRKGRIELVEQKVMEDNPQRTISLWRERVAQGSGGSSQSDGQHSETDSHAHRRTPSGDSHLRRMMSDGKADAASSAVHGGSTRAAEGPKSGKVSYERSEANYMVAYHQPSKGGFPKAMYTLSESGHALPPINTGGNSMSSYSRNRKVSPKGPSSPTQRRTSGRASYERSEFMVTYPQTPPHSGGSVASLPSPKGQRMVTHRESPYNPIPTTDASSMTKATSTSSVELILSSCEPSLLHIAPVLSELGIHRMDHLRAVSRLSEETRDREIKEPALKKGITVMEWAILLDKLQTL
ncbi:hypothetical protein B0H21DRAFT_687736 [Amylocystis lapponica]|nr:hypothetical protein B0H21DRAFT_687736 [Amylocystis lapponica]